jgi:hypothetical protein
MAKKINEQKLLDMQLHDIIQDGKDSRISVQKVIGGWIYWYKLGGYSVSGVFVPNREEAIPFLRKISKELKQSKK